MRKSSLLKTFLNEPIPPYITKGEGLYIYMNDKKKYFDLTGGFTSNAILGWTQPNIEKAIIKQLKKIPHIDYKVFSDENRDILSNLLVSKTNSSLDRVFFVGGSGGEACEVSMKLSFQTHQANGNKKKHWFISREQSYHGSTTHSIAVGDRPNLDLFKPMFPIKVAKISEHNIYRGLLDNETIEEYTNRCVDMLEDKILEIGAEKVAGFIGETIMGGLVGDVPPAKNYWKKIKNICDKYDIHLILDEVWCGTGTSGKIYCFDWDGVDPDFVFLGKTLGAGFAPLSAVITNSKIEECLKNGFNAIEYSNTHQGHSLCVAATLEAQKIIHNDEFLNEVIKKGQFLRDFLEYELGNNEFFKNVRGRGLRNSLEYNCVDQHLFGLKISEDMRQNHNILISGKWHRIGFAPALTITQSELEFSLNCFVDTFKNAVKNWNKIDKSRIYVKPIF